MKFHKLHDEHNAILVTPQYGRDYGIKLSEWYPTHEIIPSTMVSAGNSYLVNKDELLKQYNEKLNENTH
jgi:hypothetical protein